PPPASNQFRVMILYNIKTPYLRHIEVVDKSNLSSMIFCDPPHHHFNILFIHNIHFVAGLKPTTYLRITHALSSKYAKLNTPRSTKANNHCVLGAFSAK